MDIEMSILCKIISEGSVKNVVDARITPEFFYGKGKAIFSMLFKHYQEYRKTPNLDTVLVHFPDFIFSESHEPLDYYVNQLRERHKHNIIVQGLHSIADKLSGGDIREAENQLYSLTSKIATEIRISTDINYAHSFESRKNRYELRKKFHGVDGIPTLLEPLDKVTGGARGGDLITILGQPGVGKTWVSLVIARAALKCGYKVLFITKEMEAETLATRMDAALLGFSYERIKRGLLGDDMEKQYFSALETLGQQYTDFVISGDNGEGGVTVIQAKIEEHSPDLVIIDGSYLIVDEDGGKVAHERAMNITRRLKRLALKTHLPIYNSTQAGRQVKRSVAPSLEDVAFSYAYAQDSDVVISVYRSPEMDVACKIGLKMAKVREGDNSGHYILQWDFDNMQTFGLLASDISGVVEEEDTGVIF